MPGFEVFGEEERAAINELFDLNGGILFAHGFDAIRNGVYKVREFEAAVAQKFSVRYAQAVSSGSAALRVALSALDVRAGDEIIVPSFTFVATIEAVVEAGAIPIIVDIDESLTICPSAFEQAISSRTVGVIPVHMLGSPANMDRIMEIAKAKNLFVLEDAAQAVGGTYGGRSLGTIGDAGCFSFDAGKVIITGEGGMVLTNSEAIYKKARAYHDHGHSYDTPLSRGDEGAVGTGFNYRMTEIQGAIGLVQLSKLKLILDTQRKNKAKIKSALVNNNFPFKFRRLNDKNGELGDALVIRFESCEQAKSFALLIREAGLSTKIIPDAMRWHFASHWSRFFDESGPNQTDSWLKSGKILESSVAFPVMIKMSDDRINYCIEKFLEIGEMVRNKC